MWMGTNGADGLRQCTTRGEGDPGSIHDRVLVNFLVTYSFCPYAVALGSTQHLTEMSTKEYSWG